MENNIDLQMADRLQELRDEKDALDSEKRDIDARIAQAKQLSEEYEELIGDDKVNTGDAAPDFKDE